jgi:hypothetical protein
MKYMKKIVLFIAALSLFVNRVIAQDMLSIYNSGPVKLVPVEDYGDKNNWDELFGLYYQDKGITYSQQEEYKKIVVAPDGSVFMSHKNRYEIWKFGPDGNFVKRFGSKGGKYSQFQSYPSIQPVVNDRYVFTSDLNGRLKFFDLDGNYVKSINLDYIPMDFQFIGNSQLLMSGYAIWSKSTRYFITTLDVNNAREDIIYDYFIGRSSVKLTLNNIDSIIDPEKRLFQILEVPDRDDMVLLPGGGFVLTNRTTGKLTSIDNTGKLLVDTKMGIQRIRITEEDALKNYEKIKKVLVMQREVIRDTDRERQDQRIITVADKMLSSIEVYKDVDNYNPYLPYYSNIIVDNEGNMLVFEFTERDGEYDNIFNVIAYSSTGETIARTSFVCDEYELNISSRTFVISNGYVYAVVRLRNYEGMPLRLVKFRCVPIS